MDYVSLLMQAARRRWRGGGLKLADAVRLSGGGEFDGHRALADARAAAVVWRFLRIETLEGEK